MQNSATPKTTDWLQALSTNQLTHEYRRLIWELYVLDSAPTDCTLPDEWFVARASTQAALEAEAFDILMESCSRKRWDGSEGR